jgi:flagellar protein FliS
MNYAKAAAQYQTTGADAGVLGANPHQLIQLLYDKILEHIAVARGHIGRGDAAAKGSALNKALAIVAELRSSLNREQGGEVAQNLDALYDYIERLLIQANIKASDAQLDEAAQLVRDIKSAWDAIPESVRRG